MKKLVLFMTYGGSLQIWKHAGILDRELSLYKEYHKLGYDIHIVSYGNKDEISFQNNYDFITIHCNKWNLHPRIYALLLPILHRKILNKADLYKTNQLYGAHIAYRAKKLWKKPLIVRQGYGHYEHRVEEFGENSRKAKLAKKYENFYLSQANLVVFTTKKLSDRAIERHLLDNNKVHVIPNYIVPDVWEPNYKAKKQDRKFHFVFYGRYTEQKNLENFVKSLEGKNVKLTLIGGGPLEESLKKIVLQYNIDVRFLPRCTQSELKNFMSEADAFILPSHYEGHPKSLLESMAYGMPILAANSPGIKEEICHKQNGILMDTDIQSMSKAVDSFINTDLEMRVKLGKKAREYALERYSVKTIAKQEAALIGKEV